MATKYTREILQDAVNNSLSFSGVLRHLGLRQAGGTQSHIISKIKQFEIDTSHFTGQLWSKGRTNLPKVPIEEILVVKPEGSVRTRRRQLLRAMLESGLDYRCKCGLDGQWEGKELTLEINHKDGNWLNNLLDNLEFICPNCHSQETHSNKPHKYRRQGTVA